MQAFVPKTRRPKFELVLKIIDLNNVPLVTGTSLIKWHLPHSSAAEHRGRTAKCHIKEHKVAYDYEKTLTVKLTVDKSGTLEDSNMNFEVLQEYSSGARGERIILGNVKLNLAEYVDANEFDGEDGVCRRYLMQDSKINSTLKIGIKMTLVDGDRNFVAPPLKSAPVFGGIAGIIAGEAGESDEPGQLPNLTSKSRETGETQDMYRRNLAAYWTAQPGELRADDCIEDIFAGGDGWATGHTTQPTGNSPFESRFGSRSGRGGHGGDGVEERRGSMFRGGEDDDVQNGNRAGNTNQKNGNLAVPSHRSHSFRGHNPFSRRNQNPPNASSTPSPFHHTPHHQRSDDDLHHSRNMSMGSTTSMEQQATPPPPRPHMGQGGIIEHHAQDMKAEESRKRHQARHEVDEFDLREDLRSWKLPDAVH